MTVKSSQEGTPQRLRPFVTLGFDYNPNKVAGLEAFGECVFCGKRDKLYINTKTGQWSCKSGTCGLTGNLITFMEQWWEMFRKDLNSSTDREEWEKLSTNRGLPVETLKESGLAWDGEKWALPLFSPTGHIHNIRLFKLGREMRGLPTVEASMFGAEQLSDTSRRGEVVYICEGEFDAIALRHLLGVSDRTGIAVGVPGVGAFKVTWVELLAGRHVVLCYDHDAAGDKGAKRAHQNLKDHVRICDAVYWPEELPEKFDMRDFVVGGGTYDELWSIISKYKSDVEMEAEKGAYAEDERPPLSAGTRPTFEQTLAVFKEHLHMGPDLVDALRMIFAVVYSNQVDGDPVWMHLVSPPGSGKTALLMSLRDCPSCYFMSSLTPHTLVSGYGTKNEKEDPSVLPQLDGKTFVLKDFTEVLNMGRDDKDEVYGVLRGAYDEDVERRFGNGVYRKYRSHFNMICGVTHAVFGERSASLGERFLMFHVLKGVGFEADMPIRAAIRNVGKENSIRTQLSDAARAFVEVRVTPDDVPELTDEHVDRITALSQVVSMLRASVEKDFRQEKMLNRPQHEMGTRLAKQMAKLLMGLGMLNSPPEIGRKEYDLVVRVAMDTCVGFNLEPLGALIEKPLMTAQEVSDYIRLPLATLRDQLEDLVHLGVVRKVRAENPAGRGAPIYRYLATERIMEHWENAGLLKAKASKPKRLMSPENRVRRVRPVKRNLT